MGEMADEAIERAENELFEFEEYQYSDAGTQYEHGLIDEYGVPIGNPSSNPFKSGRNG